MLQIAEFFVLSISFFGSELFEQEVKNCDNAATVTFSTNIQGHHVQRQCTLGSIDSHIMLMISTAESMNSL